MTMPRFILAFLLVALVAPLAPRSQVMLPHRRSISSIPPASSLPCGGTLKYWWVASDLPDGLVSSWTDRVAGVVYSMSNTNRQPLKTDDYLVFSGQQHLTNSGVSIAGSANHDSVAIIYRPEGISGAQSMWVRYDTDAFGFLLNQDANGRLHWFEGGGTITLVSSGMNTTNIFDVVTRYTGPDGSDSIWETYTNNVVVSTNSAISPFSLKSIGAGAGENNFFYGAIYEIQVYDCSLAVSDVEMIHDYRVAQYGSGFTPPGPPDNPLIMQYDFNEGSGTSMADASGNGHTGTNNATWVTGKSGSGFALQFNGSSQWARTFDTVDWGVSTITACMWLYVDSFTSAGANRVLELTPNYQGTDNTFVFDPSSVSGAADVGMQSGTGAPSLRRYETFSRWSAATWTHIAIVYNNTTTSGDIKVYVNGSEVGTTLVVNTKDQAGNFANAILYIAAQNASGLWFPGRMDDFRVYSGELTSDEINYVMNDPQ